MNAQRPVSVRHVHVYRRRVRPTVWVLIALAGAALLEAGHLIFGVVLVALAVARLSRR